MREIEVKLKIEDLAAVRERLARAGAQPRGPELFEDNRVYDTPGRDLKASGKVLRLRTVGATAVLTLKSLPADTEPEGPYKHRLEFETKLEKPEQMQEILLGLGYELSWGYQKFRQSFGLGEVEILLDRTPIGDFLEIEGSPQGIETAARALGFDRPDFITKTYRDLQEEAAGTSDPGPMIFPGGGPW